MEENKLTICANCKHRVIGNFGTGNPDIWYNNLCKASPRTKDNFNVVTGKYEKDELNYCRDINTRGNCVKYEEKKKEQLERVSTKKCTNCGNEALLRLPSLNLKICPDCDTKIPWYKEETEEDFI